MTLPVLPEPSTLDAATVAVFAAQIVAWAASSDDLNEVRDAAARWAAITEYVRRTSREGIAEAESALRRLEMRVGALLGPANTGGDRRSDQFDRDRTGLAPDARSDFRTLADHPDVVESVIAESSDASPPSRRKCLTAIARQRLDAELAEEAAELAAVMPKVLAALEALPDEKLPDLLITLRLHGVHRDDLDLALPPAAEIITIEEVWP